MNLKQRLQALLSEYAAAEGTDLSGAIRDMLTDLLHIGDEVRIDIHERLAAASEVQKEEQEGE